MIYMQGFKCFPIKTTLIPFLTQESLIEKSISLKRSIQVVLVLEAVVTNKSLQKCILQSYKTVIVDKDSHGSEISFLPEADVL